MKETFDIHPDFRKLPGITLSFKAWIVSFLNLMMMGSRYFLRENGRVAKHKVAIARADGSLMRVIRMVPHNVPAPMPCLVYFHGGAFALTYGSSHISVCQRYASEVGCTVVFVDYRLMPAHPFPGGLDDSYLAYEWVLNNAHNIGVDTSRIALGGDSAGGALAAVVGQLSVDLRIANPCAQMLIYPVIDSECKTRSATRFTDTPIFNSEANRRMWRAYLCDYAGDETPDYASPIHRHTFAGLPPAYIETAEFDPLHDEGVAYATCLGEAGVEVVLNDTKRTVHGYDAATKSALGEDAIARRISYLKKSFE